MKKEKKLEYKGHREPEAVLQEFNHLPVARLREVIREQIRIHPNFVLIGETGSGKTTCLPPLLLELRNELGLEGGIAVTQPRRIATRSVTDRVSDMMGTEVGDTVGYHVRFDDGTTDKTDITFMTDGILLRKIQFDPLLTEYCIVMIDEAHERSLNIDLCLGLLKDVNNSRLAVGMEPIRIVITSATIERNKFAGYIGYRDTTNSLEIPGKMFPVQIFYEEEIPQGFDYTQAAANKVTMIVDQGLGGDILIFMPGKKEINLTVEKIKAQLGDSALDIMPLHAELSPEEQDRVFLPSSKQKVIVSTNVAETSVTIDGIVHVIDTGLIKETRFDSHTGIEQLVLVEHAISGLDQRKGRAGRTAPGFCYRLFTESSLHRRPRYQTPEIMRSNLSQIVLAMKKVGIHNIEGFNFIDQPDRKAIQQALHSLTLLGALDRQGELTEIGEFMVEIGLEPRLSRMLIEAAEQGDLDCINNISKIAAVSDGKNFFIRPTEFNLQKEADRLQSKFKNDNDSDFIVILNVWNAYAKSGYDPEWAKANYLNEKVLEEARNVRLEILDVLASHGISINENANSKINKDALGKAVTAGLIGNLMRYDGKHNFKKVDGTKGEIGIHPSSVFYNFSFNEESLIVSDEIFMNPLGKAYACNCLRVKPDWLREIAPELARDVLHAKGGKSHNFGGRNHSHNLFSRRNKRR